MSEEPPDSEEPKQEASQEESADEGVVTSASSSVGSLLSDLLSEAQKEVEQERDTIRQKIHERDETDRLTKAKEEAQAREENTRRVVQETRRRNQAFARAEQDEAAQAEAMAEARPMLNAASQVMVTKTPKGAWIGLVLAIIGVFVLGFLFMDARGQVETAATKSLNQQDKLDALTASVATLKSKELGLSTQVTTLQSDLQKAKTRYGKAEALAAAKATQLDKIREELKKTSARLAAATTATTKGSASKRRRRKGIGKFKTKGFFK
jgi:chromosome segregation ATPase